MACPANVPGPPRVATTRRCVSSDMSALARAGQMRPTLSTSLGPASTKRFADRHAAHAELGGQFSLLELGAVEKPSAHDRVLEPHVDVVRQSLALNAVQVAVCLSRESGRVPLLCAPCHEYRLDPRCRGHSDRAAAGVAGGDGQGFRDPAGAGPAGLVLPVEAFLARCTPGS